MKDAYTTDQAARLTGNTYRNLHYWDATGLVSPSIATAQGSGSRRLYSVGDVQRLRAVRLLLDTGFSLRAVRAILRNPAHAGDVTARALSRALGFLLEAEAVPA